MNSILSYLHKTQEYSVSRYMVEMTILGYSLKLIGAVIFYIIIYGITGQDITLQMDDPVLGITLVLSALLVAPLIETVLGQMIPVWLTGFFTQNIYIKVMVSAIFFTIMHPFPSYGALFPIAFIFAWTYCIKQKRSIWHAYGMTAGLHAIHNAIALLFLI